MKLNLSFTDNDKIRTRLIDNENMFLDNLNFYSYLIRIHFKFIHFIQLYAFFPITILLLFISFFGLINISSVSNNSIN